MLEPLEEGTWLSMRELALLKGLSKTGVRWRVQQGKYITRRYEGMTQIFVPSSDMKAGLTKVTAPASDSSPVREHILEGAIKKIEDPAFYQSERSGSYAVCQVIKDILEIEDISDSDKVRRSLAVLNAAMPPSP